MEKVQNIEFAENIMDTLLSYKYYNENVVLMINNKTEGLQPKVIEHTLKLLELLKSKSIKNPKMLITKLPVPDKAFDLLDNNNVMVFTTYSGMPTDIEPTSNKNNLNKILGQQKRLKENTDAKLVHYWRPIVRGLNSEIGNIKEIIEAFSQVFDCSVISGIRLTANVREFLESRGANFSDWNNDIGHKFLPSDIFASIAREVERNAPKYPIFKKTSCAISYLFGRYDYNLSFLSNNGNCIDTCYNSENCMRYAPKIDDKIIEIIRKSGLNKSVQLTDFVINVDNTISQETKSFLKHSTGLDIVADRIVKSETERLFYERNGRSL